MQRGSDPCPQCPHCHPGSQALSQMMMSRKKPTRNCWKGGGSRRRRERNVCPCCNPRMRKVGPWVAVNIWTASPSLSPFPIMHRRLQCTWPGDPSTLPLFNRKPCSLWGLPSNCGACALPGLPLSDLPAAFELSLTCPVSFHDPHFRHPCHCWCLSPLPGVYVLAMALVLTAQDLWYIVGGPALS